MCGSMVDIHSPTAEIRRGKERRKKPQHKNIMVCPIPQGDHNQTSEFKKNSSGDEIANVNYYAVRPETTRIR